MGFNPEYPFSPDDCDHERAFTDPENVGLCKQCMAINMALSPEPVDMEEIEVIYTIAVGLDAAYRGMEDAE